MESVEALYTIKKCVSSGAALTRNLDNPSHGELYKKFERYSEVQKDGPLHKAMKLGKGGWSSIKSEGLQPGRINIEGLLWPLTVPWSNSFLTMSNIVRDFPRHAVSALVEKNVVELYHPEMIAELPAVGTLRREMTEILTRYLPDKDEFAFADGIQQTTYKEKKDIKLESLLKNERQMTMFGGYNSELADIIKYCSKKKIILHPCECDVRNLVGW